MLFCLYRSRDPLRSQLVTLEHLLADRRRPVLGGVFYARHLPEPLHDSSHMSRDRHVLRRLQPSGLRLAQHQHPPGVPAAAALQVRHPYRRPRAQCGG